MTIATHPICARCGELYSHCPHTNTACDVGPKHAARIQAAYALGKRLNPDHDTTSYYRQTLLPREPVTDFKERAR